VSVPAVLIRCCKLSVVAALASLANTTTAIAATKYMGSFFMVLGALLVFLFAFMGSFATGGQ
jgi:hypothetical protein